MEEGGGGGPSHQGGVSGDVTVCVVSAHPATVLDPKLNSTHATVSPFFILFLAGRAACLQTFALGC